MASQDSGLSRVRGLSARQRAVRLLAADTGMIALCVQGVLDGRRGPQKAPSRCVQGFVKGTVSISRIGRVSGAIEELWTQSCAVQ